MRAGADQNGILRGDFMSNRTSRIASWSLALMVAVATLPLGGCNPSNQNENEFLSSTKPGIPSDRPDEKVSERRARLMTKSTLEKKAEKKQQARGKK
jgi:hypothetical protein